MRIRNKKNVDGLSFSTQLMYALGTVMRFIYSFDTRISLYLLSYIEMALSFCLNLILFYLFYKFRHTAIYKESKLLSWYTIIPVCTLLSLYYHPGDEFSII